MKRLGADVLVDYRRDDFETIVKDYGVVLHSQDVKTLQKSLRVLRPGGKLISISGPPDPEFGEEIGAGCFMTTLMWFLSWGVKKRAKRLNVDYSFLFMRANGCQLSETASLVDSGIIRPVVDRVFPFSQTNEAMAYVETGRAEGKVVVDVT